MEGKDMTLSDFLSKIKVNKSNPYNLIPILFDLLQEIYNIHTSSEPKKQKIL